MKGDPFAAVIVAGVSQRNFVRRARFDRAGLAQAVFEIGVGGGVRYRCVERVMRCGGFAQQARMMRRFGF